MDHYEKAEVRRILEAAKAVSSRDWLLLGLWYAHGLRVSEVIGIKRDDIDGTMLTVAREKGSKLTIQELWTDADPAFSLAPAVLDYSSQMHGNQRLFPICRQQAWRILRKYQKLAGVRWPRGVRGVLKHSLGMNYVDKTGVLEMSQILGHSDIRTTMKYVETNDKKAGAALTRARQT